MSRHSNSAIFFINCSVFLLFVSIFIERSITDAINVAKMDYEIENLVSYHNEVTLSMESILANIPVEYNVIDSRGTFGDEQRFGDLIPRPKWNVFNHGLRKLVFSVTQTAFRMPLLPFQEKATYITWIHEPNVFNDTLKGEIVKKSSAIIFLTAFIRDKWKWEFKKHDDKLEAFSMIPVFDISILQSKSKDKIMGPKKWKSKSGNGTSYIILPGRISRQRRDFASLMKAYDQGLFPNNVELVLMGPKPFPRKPDLPPLLDKYLNERFTMISEEEDLAFIPFFQYVYASRGIFLGVIDTYEQQQSTDKTRKRRFSKSSSNKYFEDKSTGNIALAMSLGVPIIGDSRLRKYIHEVMCCTLLYNRQSLTAGMGNDTRHVHASARQSQPPDQPLMLRDAVSGDMEVRDLGSLHFDTLRDLLHWLGALSEYEMEKMKDHILRHSKEFLLQNAVLMRDSIIPTASNK